MRKEEFCGFHGSHRLGPFNKQWLHFPGQGRLGPLLIFWYTVRAVATATSSGSFCLSWMLVRLHRYSFTGLGLMPFPPLKEQCFSQVGLPPLQDLWIQVKYIIVFMCCERIFVLKPCAFSSLLSFVAFIFWSSFLNTLFSSGLGNQVASCLLN